MEETRYIAVEGAIGVGKTSLVNLLSKKFHTRKVLEAAEENPFLKDFYSDIRRYAFQTQLFFLLSRYRQQAELMQQHLFNRTTICDYLFAKDKIFAYLNLDDNELKLYEQIYKVLDAQITKPDLVIFLQANADVLTQRIKLRGREYEKKISYEYINNLNQSYNYFFFHYTDSPLLVINTNEIDFVKNIDDLDDLANRITNMKKGIQYYTPLGSTNWTETEGKIKNL